MLKKFDFILLNDFLKSHNYTEEEIKYIIQNFGKENVLGLLKQIYAKLNILPLDENEYLIIYNYLLKNFDLGCNILEIACGNYPVLAEQIDKFQTKIGKGTITVIDPQLSVEKLGNIHLVKESFNYGDDISNYDLIISQSPCLMLDDIAVSAINKNKQFFISMCKCIYDRYPYLMDYFFDDGYDPIFDKLLSEMRILNKLNGQNNLKIDSNIIFTKYNDIKCYTGKCLKKK